MMSAKNTTDARRESFLGRLRRDKRGNAMVIMGVSIIPLIGIMGGAVDFSRAYLVKNRMQQACDAGVLAGRRSMVGTVMTTADKNEAYRLFAYNFPNGTMGSTALVQNQATGAHVNVVRTSTGQMGMVAATTVPTTLLRIIGKTSLPARVSCTGEEYYVNTDVLFVMDTTGSMNCAMGAALSCAGTSEVADSKMAKMRSAIKTLFTDLIPARDSLKARNLRLRVGFVAYSQNANVGKLLYAKNTAYIRNPYPYYNSSGNAKTAYSHNATWFNNTWNGCIEERSTVNTIIPTTTSIPTAAYDLDIDTLPTNDATRWGPMDAAQEESESTVQASTVACPKAAVALQEWPNQTAFNTQVDVYTTGIGRTHHDTGMIWGTRMLSHTGVFGADNPTMYNGVKVSKTMVFMTDGYLDVATDYYSAYSVPKSAGRTAAKTATEATLEANHQRRFELMCTRAKTLGIDIWVVAILPSGSAITTSLSNCASSPSQAITVGSAADLTAAFARISDKVGNLRVGS